jgi:hypothetical protein
MNKPKPKRNNPEDAADIERAVYDGMQDLRAEKPAQNSRQPASGKRDAGLSKRPASRRHKMRPDHE